MIYVLPVQAADKSNTFGQGTVQLSLMAGNGIAYDSNYFIIGAGVNYFLFNGVGVGLSYENWSGNSPHINQVTTSIQYVMLREHSVSPYVGMFYRNITISDQPNMNSEGARAGVYFSAGAHNVLGVGLAYESYLNCQPSVFGACNAAYPEISLIFGF